MWSESLINLRLSSKAPSTEAFSLSAGETLKITLTTQEGSSAKKPHQAYLQLHDAVTGLEDAYAFSVKENGKAKLELVRRCGSAPMTVD